METLVVELTTVLPSLVDARLVLCQILKDTLGAECLRLCGPRQSLFRLLHRVLLVVLEHGFALNAVNH